MRINVVGGCPSAIALRGDLALAGYYVTDQYPRYTFFLEEEDIRASILVDSIDCALDDAIVRRIRREAPDIPLEIQTQDGIQSEQAIRIVLPKSERIRKAVETAALRAVGDMLGMIASRNASFFPQQAFTPWNPPTIMDRIKSLPAAAKKLLGAPV